MDGPIVPPPPLGGLASAFARFGNSTFGGGTATIVQIEGEIIDRRGWISRDDSHVAYAISRLTPGTNLLSYCVAVGWRMRGWLGASVALGATSIPCAAIATALTIFFTTWAEHPVTARALEAALAAAIAIMVGTAWTMIRPYVQNRQYVRTFSFTTIAFALALVGGQRPLRVLVAAAVAGALLGYPEKRE